MYYVTMTDKFMSGWGNAEGLKNKLIFECETREEADNVVGNAEQREEMIFIALSSNKPRYYRASYTDYVHINYYVQKKYKETMGSWYERDYFKNKVIK